MNDFLFFSKGVPLETNIITNVMAYKGY